MAKQVVECMVEGGKATAAPPLGPALGPLGVNIGQVVAAINKKTAEFKGVQVPVKVVVNTADKSFEIVVGTPPVSALVKQEAHIEKGSGTPHADMVADLKIEQVIKIAKMKESSLLGKDLKARVREVIGTCNSMGVMVEGRPAKEVLRDIERGAFAEEIRTGKTELSAEELREIEEKRKKLVEELEKRKAEYTAMAKQIIESLAGQSRAVIKSKLLEAKIPIKLIEELLPVEAAGAPAAKAVESKEKEVKK